MENNNNKYSAYESLLTCPAEEFGERASKLFMEWRKDETMSCAFLADMCEKFIGPADENIMNATRAALKLADEKSGNAYHNDDHNREVAAVTLALLVCHRKFKLQPAISNDMAWLTVAAGAVHDYGHDGMTNKIDGVVQPMRMEKLSLEAVKPTLMAAGLSAHNWYKLCMIVLLTDVTPTDKPSPSAQLKEIYEYNAGLHGFPENIDPMFLALTYDHELTACSEMVSDADLGISAGLDWDITQENSRALSIESHGAIPWTPKSLEGYLTYVCKKFPGSGAGKIILGPGFRRIGRINRHDVTFGVSYNLE